MADVTQQVLIEFTSSTEGLAPAVDQLERLGQIDKATAASFKATNAELKAREATLKATATSTKAATDSTKKSIADVDAAVKNLTNDFTQGFNEGVIEALNEAGVSLEEFQAAMAKLQQSGKGVAQLEQQVASLTAELDAMKKGSQSSGTEIESLTAQLAEQQKQLTELQAAYEKLLEGQKDNTEASTSLRARLKEITAELALMKVSGEAATNPEKYAALTSEAGNLRDALADVNEEISRAGSDTGGFDSLIQVAQGVAGGFAVAQGAAALFGDESEELQEVLLRVNAAMAVLQGLQQLQAVYAARVAIARGLETAATTVATVATTAYNFVVGASIGLMKAFRIALAATGIGLLVIALIELVSWLSDSADELENLNNELEHSKTLIEANTAAINTLSDGEVVRAEAASALESEILRLRGLQISQQKVLLTGERDRLLSLRSTFKTNAEGYKELTDRIRDLDKEINAVNTSAFNNEISRSRKLLEESLNSQIATTERAILIAGEGTKAQLVLQQKLVRDKLQLELQTQSLTEAQKLILIAKANRDQLDLQNEFNKRIINLDVSRLQDQLKSAEQGSLDELRIRQEILRKQAAAEVLNSKLSEDEKFQIRQEAANEAIRLELAFNSEQRRIRAEQAAQARADDIQIAIARNATALALAKEGTDERFQLEIEAILLAASEARRVAGQNALEINRINAQAQEQILALKRQFAEEAVEYEIRLEVAKNGRLVRSLQRVLSDERSTFDERVRSVNELFLIEANAIDRRKQALRDMYAANLISQKDYNVKYAELEDERARISEETEQQILDATRARTARQIQTSIELSNQLVGVLDSVFQNQTATEQSRLEEQRRNIDELRESGAITEKEAIARRRKLEIEERQAQQRQAQREKQIAVFRALLAIPSAFLQGTAQGGPILGAIYAAIAAAQAALIISQPIPKFGKGKKNNYQGLAEVGETGSELIESNGQMYVAPKRTIVWLGSRDKVYNPKETAAMLEKPGLRAARLPEGMGMEVQPGVQFDYDKLGQAIAKNQKDVSLNIDGYKQFVINGHSFTTYLNARRGY